jgi:hypothetical protein
MKFVNKERSPSGRLTRCTLQFDSTVNHKLLQFPRLRKHCRKLRGTNLVYEIGVDGKNRLQLTFASGYFNGRSGKKTTMLKSAIRILNAVPERILSEDPSEMAAWYTLHDVIDKTAMLQILDQDKFSKSALTQFQKLFESNYEACHSFMKNFDREVNLMKSKLKELTQETVA